jgi:tRNA threonylcarbamoyladenosine biosynthesis protein TsaE
MIIDAMSMNWVIRSASSDDTERVGEYLGPLIKAPEVIELRSDLGGGKTTFVKGLVKGLGSSDRVGSPTFTLNRIYKANNLEIHHFDFYRLQTPGIISEQLEESLQNNKVITVVEWADIIKDVLPEGHISIEFKPTADNEDERIITFDVPEAKMDMIEKLRTKFIEVEP